MPLRQTKTSDPGPHRQSRRSPRGIPHRRTSAKTLFPSKVKRAGSRGLVVHRSLWGPLQPTAAAGQHGPCSGQTGSPRSSSPPRRWCLSLRSTGAGSRAFRGEEAPARHHPPSTEARGDGSLSPELAPRARLRVCGPRAGSGGSERPSGRPAEMRRPLPAARGPSAAWRAQAQHPVSSQPFLAKICSSTSETNLPETTQYLSHCFLAQQSDVCMEKYRQLHTSWWCNI